MSTHISVTRPSATLKASVSPTHDLPRTNHATSPWANPAAAAALRSNVELLRAVEEGIVKNFQDVDRVRTYAIDLRATTDMFMAATGALSTDKSTENDQVLPIISQAESRIVGAESRLSAKDLTSTWPAERTDILSAVRFARVISENVARQVDATNPE